MIHHDRRRWYILIIASVAYLCSHSYVFGIMATIGFDFIMNAASVLVTGPGARWSSINWLVLDVFVRMGTIVVGVTINAFASYVFDLSYLYGLQWLYLATVVLVYIFVRMVDWGDRDWNRKHSQPTWGVDYVFGIVSLSLTVFFMNFVAFGEPYTFMTEMIYITSVVGLVVTSDVQVMKWKAFFVFVIFWIIAIIVGLIVNTSLDKDFRFPLSYYFTKTPLIN